MQSKQKANLRVIEFNSKDAIFELCIPEQRSRVIVIPRVCPVIDLSELQKASDIANQIIQKENLNYDLEVKELEYGFC